MKGFLATFRTAWDILHGRPIPAPVTTDDPSLTWLRDQEASARQSCHQLTNQKGTTS